jgi:hypothetical protein
MKTTSYSRSGTALMVSIIMTIVTMVLHPSGGSIEYIQKIATVIIISHCIAIAATPLSILGFWGLTKKLQDESMISLTAFIASCIAMFAGVCAAAINGLALPLFSNRYIGATPETIAAIKPIFGYGSSLNHAFDFLFIGFCCLAILLWSLAILKTRALPSWLGWTGVLIVTAVIIIAATGFVLVDLRGFRLFIACLVIWLFLAAFSLRRATD